MRARRLLGQALDTQLLEIEPTRESVRLGAALHAHVHIGHTHLQLGHKPLYELVHQPWAHLRAGVLLLLGGLGGVGERGLGLRRRDIGSVLWIVRARSKKQQHTVDGEDHRLVAEQVAPGHANPHLAQRAADAADG